MPEVWLTQQGKEEHNDRPCGDKKTLSNIILGNFMSARLKMSKSVSVSNFNRNEVEDHWRVGVPWKINGTKLIPNNFDSVFPLSKLPIYFLKEAFGNPLLTLISETNSIGTEKVPQRNFVTKILPNIGVNFLVRSASKPLFYWIMTSNPLEMFRKHFGAVRAIFWLYGSFLAPAIQSGNKSVQ